MGLRHLIHAAAAVATISINAASQSGPIAEHGPRQTVRLTPESPLADYLKESDRDKHVIVVSPDPPPQRLGPRPGQTRASFLAEVSDLVVGIRAERVHGLPMRVTDWRAPGAAFAVRKYERVTDDLANRVVSTVSSRIELVLKEHPRASGDRLVFEEEYGTATIRGVKVEYSVPWFRPLVAGRRYLLFASFGEKGEENGQFFRNEAYEEPSPGALLTRMFADEEPRPNDEFESLGFEQALFHTMNQMKGSAR